MEQVLLVFYVLLAVAIVALILLQQGRGADMGASFGAGASQTVFGAAGTGNMLTRSTAILAALFFLASVGLAVMAKHKAEALREGGIPVLESPLPGDNATLPAAPAEGAGSDVPGAAGVPAAAGGDVPAASDLPLEAPPAKPVEATAPGGDMPTSG